MEGRALKAALEKTPEKRKASIKAQLCFLKLNFLAFKMD